MAKARPTYAKRMKELAQMERKREKAARRAKRREETEPKADVPEGAANDSDIAHIIPGPQPTREEIESDFDGLF